MDLSNLHLPEGLTNLTLVMICDTVVERINNLNLIGDKSDNKDLSPEKMEDPILPVKSESSQADASNPVKEEDINPVEQEPSGIVVTNKELESKVLELLDKLMAGKRNKDAAAVVQAALLAGAIMRPTHKQFVGRYGAVICSTLYNRYVGLDKKMLNIRLGNSKHQNNPKMKELAKKLHELQERMRQEQADSIEFLRQLLLLAKQVMEVEREIDQPGDRRKQAKAALTELFETVRSEKTPIAVERIVNDIDEQVVSIIRRFPNAFKALTGKQEIRKSLRSLLWLKYKIKDNDVYEKACQYVEQYYPDVVVSGSGAQSTTIIANNVIINDSNINNVIEREK